MQRPRDRSTDLDLSSVRHAQRLSAALFGLGAFAVVADVLSDNYEAPVWVGPLLLVLAGGVAGKSARDAIQSFARRATTTPEERRDDPA